MLGSAQPAGEAGHNMARAVAVLAGMDQVSRLADAGTYSDT
ncbi:hypothetical protein [Actinomadura madurae]|nr:hypothetical protein [Actinomadura madurae]